MTPADAPQLLKLLQEEKLNGRYYPAEATFFWQTWTAMDPKAAWTTAIENADKGGQDGAEAILKAWAMRDPVEAGSIMAEMEDSPLARKALSGFMHGLAESNPAEAVKFVTTRLPDDMIEEAAVHVTGSMIFKSGNQGAMEWFDALPSDVPSKFSTETARVILESLSRSSPGQVEQFALKRLDQGWARQPNEQSFTASMIRRNGGSPWDYIAAVTEKHPQQEPWALASSFATRAESIQQATDWVSSNPEHPSADLILAGAAQGLHRMNRTSEASAMLEKIKDPELRQKVFSAP